MRPHNIMVWFYIIVARKGVGGCELTPLKYNGQNLEVGEKAEDVKKIKQVKHAL